MKEKVILWILALCCLLAGCAAPRSAPVPSAPPSTPEAQENRPLTVWSVYWDCQQSVAVIGGAADRIEAVSLFAAYFRDGALFLPQKTLETLQALRDSDAWAQKPIYLSVVNDVTEGETTIQKDTGILQSVLSPQQAESHARALIAMARENGFDGIEIDYEKIRKDRSLWQLFLAFDEILLPLAEEAGLGLRIVLEPGIPAETLPFPQGAAYVVMCYNLHGIGTEPGPKADLAFLRALYDRFAGLPNLSFALANGGFDWEEASGKAVSLTEKDAAALAEAHQVLPRRDAASGALSFSYTQDSTRHTVWYADSETLALWAAELDACAGKTVPISIWRVD